MLTGNEAIGDDYDENLYAHNLFELSSEPLDQETRLEPLDFLERAIVISVSSLMFPQPMGSSNETSTNLWSYCCIWRVSA